MSACTTEVFHSKACGDEDVADLVTARNILAIGLAVSTCAGMVNINLRRI